MICLVSDRRRLSAGPDSLDRLVELVAAAARAGVDVIQIRERDLDARTQLSLAVRCVAAAEGTSSKILINDRSDVAIAAGAHGVHLRSDSVDARAVRPLLRAGAVVGRSAHSVEEAVAIAGEGGVDYLIFGTMFRSISKDPGSRLATLDELTLACRSTEGVPVLAIGGITIERAADVARAGAAGIAAIGLFIPPPGASVDRHVQSVCAALRRAFDTCGAVS